MHQRLAASALLNFSHDDATQASNQFLQLSKIRSRAASTPSQEDTPRRAGILTQCLAKSGKESMALPESHISRGMIFDDPLMTDSYLQTTLSSIQEGQRAVNTNHVGEVTELDAP